MNLPQGEAQFGKTKVFLRKPKTLYDVETKRLEALHRIATKIQKVWRAWRIRKVYLELKREAMDLYKGQKERNRMSMQRGVVSFFGDFMGLRDNTEVASMIGQYGDGKVIFSELVKKVNKRNKIQDRVLLLTEKAIYNLQKFQKPKKGLNFGFKRRIDIKGIVALSVSKLADNYFVVHVPTEYDYVYESTKKTVFITLLNTEYKKIHKKPVEVREVQSIVFQLKKGTKEIEFSKDETANDGVLTKNKNKLQVKVASGVQQP